MQLFDPNNPNERKKAIAAAVLAVGAVIVLGYVFFGGSSGASRPGANVNVPSPKPTPRVSPNPQAPPDDLSILRVVQPPGQVAYGGEPNRNVFAYYEPPPPPSPVPKIVAPSPIPTPPISITSMAPSQVFARTADFKLSLTGDKFTPAVKIAIDNRDLPTQFVSAQQISATVPASFISSPGSRSVSARSNDGLYSNTYTLNVTPPPVPNYTYIGLIARRGGNDIALMVEKGSKELLNVQRGDVLGGRFRLTSISERELILTDTNLKIKHQVPLTVDTSTTGPFNRPGPRSSDDDP